MHNFKKILIAIQIIFGLLVAAAAREARATPTLTTLQPGHFREINQNLTINVVFVGYRPGTGPRDIDETVFRGELPQAYKAINRVPAIVGLQGNMARAGVSFTYNYNIVYANSSFEDAFFSYLGSIGGTIPLSFYQQQYNSQQRRSLTIGQNYGLNASQVEWWLEDNADAMLGIDTSRYTIFFINWYGRQDFKFHTYGSVEADPDSGLVTARSSQLNRMIAWGGTPPDDAENGHGGLHRIWYYDLSAGPEGWTQNWNVDNADLTGDGIPDYRMPPIWEYGNLSAYRPFNSVSHDLGLITRYVAIDELFTASPLYRPALSPPKLPTNIQLDINLVQLDPSVDGKNWINTNYILSKISKLQPLNNFSAELNDVPGTVRLDQLYYCWWSLQPCYGSPELDPFYTLSVYNFQHLNQFLEGDKDYEIPIFVYNPTQQLGARGIGGSADSTNGIQDLCLIFRSGGTGYNTFGFSGGVIHEVGHHLGLSHAEDGYDFERNMNFQPNGDLYFVKSGDESNTIMGRLPILDYDFSQFDRDNMNRDLTATYINEANSILARINASPRAGEVGAAISSADQDAAAALTAYQAMQYLTANAYAKSAYGKVLNAAAQINITIEPEAWPADWRSAGRSYMFVDNIDDSLLDVAPNQPNNEDQP